MCGCDKSHQQIRQPEMWSSPSGRVNGNDTKCILFHTSTNGRCSSLNCCILSSDDTCVVLRACKPVIDNTGQQASKGGRTEEARGQAAAAAGWGSPQQEGGYPLPRHHGAPGRGNWGCWARAVAGRCPHAPATASSLWQVCSYALHHMGILSAIRSACSAVSLAKQHVCTEP